MASQAQTDANRRNSEKSTGPASAAGKAASRMNALQSGLYSKSAVIRGETTDSLDALIAEFQDDYLPQTAGEQILVDSLVASAWILRRLVKTEAHMWNRQIVRLDQGRKFDPDTFLAESYEYCSLAFTRYQRRHDSVSREFRNNLKELTRLQAARLKANPSAEAHAEPALDAETQPETRPDPQPEPAPPPPPPPPPTSPQPPPLHPPPPQPPPPQPIDNKPVEPEIGFVPSNQPPSPEPQPKPEPATGPLPKPQQPAAFTYRLVPTGVSSADRGRHVLQAVLRKTGGR